MLALYFVGSSSSPKVLATSKEDFALGMILLLIIWAQTITEHDVQKYTHIYAYPPPPKTHTHMHKHVYKVHTQCVYDCMPTHMYAHTQATHTHMENKYTHTLTH